MTHLTQDEAELVARLRASGTRDARCGGVYMSICDTAADAISRIAEERGAALAEAERNGIAAIENDEAATAWAARATAAEAALSQMKEALKPFANLATVVLSEAPADAEFIVVYTDSEQKQWAMRLDDLRAASRALAQQPDKEGV